MKQPKSKTRQSGTRAETPPALLPRFMAVEEVARLLACSEKTVRRYIGDGRLQARKVEGMVRISVDSYLRFVS